MVLEAAAGEFEQGCSFPGILRHLTRLQGHGSRRPCQHLQGCPPVCFQIRRHPSFKMFFYEFPDSSLQKLVTTLRSQESRSLDPCRNPTGRPYPFALGLPDRFAGDHSHASCRLMGSVGHYRRRSYSHFPNSEAQLVREHGQTMAIREGVTTGRWAGTISKATSSLGLSETQFPATKTLFLSKTSLISSTFFFLTKS